MELGWGAAESSHVLVVQSTQLRLNLEPQEGKELGCHSCHSCKGLFIAPPSPLEPFFRALWGGMVGTILVCWCGFCGLPPPQKEGAGMLLAELLHAEKKLTWWSHLCGQLGRRLSYVVAGVAPLRAVCGGPSTGEAGNWLSP